MRSSANNDAKKNTSRTAVLLVAGAALAGAAFALQAGCGDDSSSAPADAGADATDLDAGSVDAGSSTDSGADGSVGDTGAIVLADGAVLDGGNPGDAGPGGTTTTLPCGTVAACPINGAVCCTYPIALVDAGGTSGYSCVGGSSCPAGDGGQTASVLHCTATVNCATGVCCVTPNQDNQGAQSVTSSCASTCALAADAGPGVQLCDPKAADAGCPANAPCSSANITLWGLSPSYGTCGGVRP